MAIAVIGLLFDLRNTRRVGTAHQSPDMVGSAHPTNTEIFSIIKPDSYSRIGDYRPGSILCNEFFNNCGETI